jgi:ethanolamine ammonia-lyase small subunit
MVQDATDSDSSESASESDVTQNGADLDAISASDAIAETDTSADEVQMQMHRCTYARSCTWWCGRACCLATTRR